MTNNIDKQSFGRGGAVIVSGTTQAIPAGDFCAISFVADTVITTALNAPALTGTQTGITYPAGFVLFTPFTGGTGAITGTVILYKTAN